MNHDEFAYFNQQLAAMLRDGIPLEGALRRLCADMGRGTLRHELQALEADLARGTPLAEALAMRELPDLYKNMLQVGVTSGNLPAALRLLADYYQQQSQVWTRLKGLMVYPLIVLFATFFVSAMFTVIWQRVVAPAWTSLTDMGMSLPGLTRLTLPLLKNLWIFPTFFGLLFAVALLVVFVPALRQRIRWRLPAFREASIARVASALHLLLKGGVNLPDAIGLVARLESKRAATDLENWRHNLANGMTKFTEVAGGSRTFPPLFAWLVSNTGEDLASGFRQAAEIYQARATHRTEMTLYSLLPVAVIFLGAIIFSEAFLLISVFVAYAGLFAF